MVVTGVNVFFTDALQTLPERRRGDGLDVDVGAFPGELGVDSGST